MGQVQPWPIQTLSMARLMPAGEEGGCQEGAYFLKKVALVLSPPGRVGFQQMKWGKKGAKARRPVIQGQSVYEL